MIAGYATLERQVAAVARDFRVLRQTADAIAAPKRSPVDLAAELGRALDPWQRAALTTGLDTLLLVTRQGGKGEVASLLALAGLLDDAGSTTVIVARSDRQSKRLMRRVKRSYRMLPNVPPAVVDSQFTLELRNGSEVLALPGSEETIRGIEAVDLLLIDEAALVPDDLFAAVYPMLATTSGRCVAMTTPRGKRGWFHQEWENGGDTWHRAKVTAPDIPRINPAWLERTRQRLGDWMFRQEFLCEFLDTEDQLFATDLVLGALSGDVTPLVLPSFGGLAQ
jgi:hypothetical protein